MGTRKVERNAVLIDAATLYLITIISANTRRYLLWRCGITMVDREQIIRGSRIFQLALYLQLAQCVATDTSGLLRASGESSDITKL